MKVLMVSSEAVPFAKTGGLADVAGTLPQALQKLGVEVYLTLPYYQMVKKSDIRVEPVVKGLSVKVGQKEISGNILRVHSASGITAYLIQQDEFFDRDYLYGTPSGDYPDNAERFIFFTKMVLELCPKINFQPDIVHCHDWQTGLIPAYLKTLYRNQPFYARTGILYTIHNIAYQGIFETEKFDLTGLPPETFSISGLEFWGKVNFMKAGINYSDAINTVSQKYSQEIQTEEFGYGLQGILRDRKDVLFGILNGVDYNEWNPEKDKFIIAQYSPQDLRGKTRCKEDLLRQFNMSPDMVQWPLLGVISRLADQKGFDLLAAIMADLMKMNLGFVLLGTGDQKYHDLFLKIARKYPRKVGIRIAFDNTLAHKIEAGSDLFLMPSRYEPCGLNQIYSLKYGTIPIVRATGGLDDTIQPFDPKTGKGNGFKFYQYDAKAFLAAIKEAVTLYHNKTLWSQLMQNAMAADYSWQRSAQKYLELYQKIVERKA